MLMHFTLFALLLIFLYHRSAEPGQCLPMVLVLLLLLYAQKVRATLFHIYQIRHTLVLCASIFVLKIRIVFLKMKTAVLKIK